MKQLSWHTEKRKVSELIPYSRNPRRLTDEQKEHLTKSIEKFNLAEIPAVNTDNTILAGHQRLKIMLLLGRGDELIDVRIPNRKLTEKETDEYCLRSNKNTGEWDFDLLAEFDEDFLKDIGFNDEELGNIFETDTATEAEEDNYEIPEDIQTDIKRGDLFELGKHRLLCGDSTDKKDVAILMDKLKADMVFTDPPYGVSYKGTNNPNGREWEVIKNDDLRGGELYVFLEASFLRYAESVKDNAALYICYSSSNHIHFEKAIVNAGFRIKQQIIWDKGMVLGHSDYHWAHEPILYCCREKVNCEWYGDRTQKTILKLKEQDLMKLKKEDLITLITNIQNNSTIQTIQKDSASQYLHPTQKPISLPFRMIVNSSLEGMLVMDLFGGSGSTLMACEQSNRRCYTMELDEKYCQVIIDRWERFTGKKANKLALEAFSST